MPCLRQLVDLGEQRLRIDHDAVADDAGDAGMQDAGRDQTEDELGAVHVDGVPGVVTALIARDDVEARRQQVDDFALAFVAPLRAKHSEIHNQVYDSTLKRSRAIASRRGRARDARLTIVDAPRCGHRTNARRASVVKEKNFGFSIDNTRCAS